MVDASTSELSERTILGGAKHALPVDLFGDDVSYVALGHLHLAQEVGQREHVRYSGSPIPLAMPEESYPHQLRIVRFESGRLAGQEAVRIPRTVDILRIPKDGPGELDAVLAQLERLEVPAHEPTARAAVAEASQGEEQRGIELAAQPFLEVRVRLSAPVPDLRQRIEAAIGDRPVRLVKIAVEHVGAKEALAESAPRRELAELDVEEVFLRCYARQFEGAPDEALLSAFHEVAEAARRALEEGEP
jgi:exonuclease SbcD